MGYISRGEVSEFHYASVGATTGEFIVSALGSADSTSKRIIRITDLKATVGGTGRTIQILGRVNDTTEQKLDFDLPANTFIDFHWEIPYKLSVVSSTGAVTGIVASASGAGVKYSVSGYIED